MARTTARGSDVLGKFLREQRQLARMSLREMAKLTQVSDAYLSQVERGMHEPSVRVLTALAAALRVPMEELVARCSADGVLPVAPAADAGHDVTTAIRSDTRLSSSQKEALLSVYRSYLAEQASTE